MHYSIGEIHINAGEIYLSHDRGVFTELCHLIKSEMESENPALK